MVSLKEKSNGQEESKEEDSEEEGNEEESQEEDNEEESQEESQEENNEEESQEESQEESPQAQEDQEEEITGTLSLGPAQLSSVVGFGRRIGHTARFHLAGTMEGQCQNRRNCSRLLGTGRLL
jgi:hypothetical protein